MSGSVVCDSINTFPITRARALVGILEDMQPAEDGLLKIHISGMERFVDESLRDELKNLVGCHVAIVHTYGPKGRWAAGPVKPIAQLSAPLLKESANNMGAIV